ncbi:MAG: retroviral-like aspartic protease family protein, partial [Candidatus Thiodiazotropha taylori]|nr:retroviral-like aspartic protease family protein [Candidatus Thiodiazotropha taylori]MCW4335989.1 reverse transcriptase domain-containing protein [Candidatus Thiodiazotropha endolucinida]
MGQASASECQDTERPIFPRIGSVHDQNGLFIPLDIFGVKTKGLLDTGSTITVISPKLFEEIPSNLRPKIMPWNRSLCMANGDTSIPRGKAQIKLTINDTEIWHSMVIADVEAPIILGYDFMYDHDCSLDIRNASLKIGENNIQCNSGSQDGFVFRIRVDSDVTVPPGCEMIIPGKIMTEDQDISQISEVLVEAKTGSTLAKQGIIVAKALVDPSKGIIPLRVLNLTNEHQILHSKSIAATAESVHSVFPIDEDGPLPELVPLRSIKDIDLASLPDHLKQVWEASAASLTEEQKCIFFELLLKNQEVFAKSKYDLGCTSLVTHSIDTQGHRPIKQAPRRLPINKRDVAEREVQAMLDNNIVQPSSSSWASPIVLVEKKDKSTRFCVDYRALNEITKKDSYPLPHIQDCLDALGGSKWFSSIDCQSGYWQVKVNPEDACKTAFTCSSGLFEFRVMPFGLCNGPPTFQRLVEHVLSNLHWKICLLYIDDIIVFSKTFEEHVERLNQVLARIKSANLKIAPKKCHFFQEKVTFLGHVVSSEGIATDPSKTESVANWPVPKNVKQVRQFVGLASYYRRYIQQFAQIARPLHKLTENGVPFLWTPECQLSFETLKQKLTSSPILAYPINGTEYILDTDASNDSLGSVLSQVQNGQERVISYYSRCF